MKPTAISKAAACEDPSHGVKIRLYGAMVCPYCYIDGLEEDLDDAWDEIHMAQGLDVE